MKYIDYVFYRIYSFYQRKEKNGPDPELSALLLLSLFSNAVLLDIIIALILLIDPAYLLLINKINAIPVILISFGFFLYRYKNKKRILEISEKWKKEGKEEKKKRAILIMMLSLISILLLIFLVYISRIIIVNGTP